MRRISVVIALVLLCVAATNTRRIRFTKGASSATVRGTVQGYDCDDYLLGVRQGQHLSASVDSKTPSTILTIFMPNGDNLPGAAETDSFAGELPVAGDYTIRVGMMRNQARRNATSNYTLHVGVQ